MSVKIASLVTLVLSSASFLTWGAVEANNKYRYNKKMEKYGKYWDEFYDKAFKSDDLKSQLCLSAIECENKSYLPKPDEYEYWLKVYKSLKSNKNFVSNTINLNNIKSPDQLIDHCYSWVKKELQNSLDYTNSSSGWFVECAYDSNI